MPGATYNLIIWCDRACETRNVKKKVRGNVKQVKQNILRRIAWRSANPRTFRLFVCKPRMHRNYVFANIRQICESVWLASIASMCKKAGLSKLRWLATPFGLPLSGNDILSFSVIKIDCPDDVWCYNRATTLFHSLIKGERVLSKKEVETHYRCTKTLIKMAHNENDF